MVARSSPAKDSHLLGHQQIASPPPSYRASANSPIILGETTTTTTEIVTTTQTTTHFFSLPLWKKRGQTHNKRQSVSGIPVDEHGLIQADLRMRTLMLDKDLPPTPPRNSSSPTFSHSFSESPRKLSTEDNVAHPAKKSVEAERHPFPSSRPSTSGSQSNSTQATAALVHAALGIGLPPVIPHASSSNSPAVSFAQPAREPRLSIPAIRRVRSFQKLAINKQNDAPPEEPHLRRRTRGLSLGPSTFLQLDPKGKGKEPEVDVTNSGNMSPKPIPRRASFWNRKRTVESSPSPLSPTVPSDQKRPSLPSVPPVSPFYFDLAVSQSSDQLHVPQHHRGLSRSYSERTTSQRSPPQTPDLLSVPTFALRSSRQSVRRPATSDASSPRQRTQSSAPVPPSFRDPSRSPSPLTPYHSPKINSSAPPAPPLNALRPRSQTNPPLLHRLSLNLFSGSHSSFDPSSVPSEQGSAMPSPTVSTESPRPSSQQQRRPSEIPKPQMEDESPEAYLLRLIVAVSKAEVANILASSADPFYVRALRAYIEQFDFTRDPLDVALRRLLMDVGLPRETQQIDRVMEAFANRYVQCNPDLFSSDDHPYILAFSLIMLHTDAFNKSNKRKMTKPDYIKNTRLPGVPPEVLDCFYDNIVFAPFIFIEDPLDINGQRGLISDSNPSRISTVSGASTAASSPSTSAILGRTSRVDPYYLITNNLLDPLRVDLSQHLSIENPFTYLGTAGPWDYTELQRSFAKATIVEISPVDHAKSGPAAYIGLGGVGNNINPLGSYTLPETLAPTPEQWTLKVTKIGLLNRKDTFLEGGKRATNRKRRQWGVILTGSQLLMFRDPAWVTLLMAHFEAADGVDFPQSSMFRPDELLSLKDAIAVFDSSYTKHEHNLRVVLSDGRQFLLQATDQQEMNAWISRINYASAFKTAGVRMRALGMSGKDVELTGLAAATSHLHDLQRKAQSQSEDTRVRGWDGNAAQALMDMLHGDQSNEPRPANRRLTMIGDRRAVGSDSPVSPEIEGAEQFKATFDEVKAQLAAERWARDVLNKEDGEVSPLSPSSAHSEKSKSRLPTRSQIIHSKIQELDAKITASQSHLNSDMRFVRNIGTLTPFQRSTRDRLQLALQNVVKRVTQVRLELAKLQCHRDVLRNDLEAEIQVWQEMKAKALKAATETLQMRIEVPTMTLSCHDSDPPQDASSPEMGSPSRRPESSTSGSFHSALDFGPEWPSSPDEFISSEFLNISHPGDSPLEKPGSSFLTETDCSFVGEPSSTSQPRSTRSSSDLVHPTHTRPVRGNHQKFFTADEGPAEQAEDWDKTKAAQRVSLVRLPSGTKMTTLYQRHRGDMSS